MLQNTKVFYLTLILLNFIIGTWLFYPAIKHGIGTAYDSIAYLSTAENIAHSNGFLSYDGRPYSNWPPLYPLLLASLYIYAPGKVLLIGLAVNIIAAYSSMLLLYYILKNLIKDQKAILYGIVLGFGSLFSLIIFTNLITETFYVPFTLLFLLLLYKYIQATSLKNFTLLICTAWLCTLQRYVGVVPVMVGFFSILFFLPSIFITRLKNAFLFSFLSVIPLIFWVIRNILVTDTVTGADRTTAIKNINYNIVNTIEQVWKWFLPYSAEPGLVYLLCFLLICALSVPLLYLWRTRNQFSPQKLMLCLLLMHTLGYIFFISFAAIIQSSSPIEPRLSAPAYFTAVPVFCFILFEGCNQYNNKAIKYSLLILGVFTLIYTYKESYPRWKNFLQEGEGLNSNRWKKSELLEYLQTDEGVKLLHQSHLYCSLPEALYFYEFGYIKNVIQEHKKDQLNNIFKKDHMRKKVIWFDTESTFKAFLYANGYSSDFKIFKSFKDGVIMEEVK